MLYFQRKYFIWTILLFITEFLIAVFLHDKIIRPYIGDLLVVILIYCFVKSFINLSPLPLAISVLLFAYLIEILQYFNFADRLGAGKSGMIRIVLGSSFEWKDLVAYTAGIILVLYLENRCRVPYLTGNKN